MSVDVSRPSAECSARKLERRSSSSASWSRRHLASRVLDAPEAPPSQAEADAFAVEVGLEENGEGVGVGPLPLPLVEHAAVAVGAANEPVKCGASIASTV